MSTTQKSLIFNYKIKDFVEIVHQSTSTCEDICIKLSKDISILPSARLLFGLRIHGTKNWLAPCRPLKSNKKYEFRIRFKVPELSVLKKLDALAYDYFYRQARYDLVHGLIDEIKYPAYKERVLGLGAVDMYIDKLESQLSIEDLEKNYKKYLQKELIKNHPYFAKKKLFAGLRDFKKTCHDLFYVKSTYIDSILTMAPNYLIEEYKGNAKYLDEDELDQGTCPVKIQFNPIHSTEPGLCIYYNYKDEWKHITRIEKIYAIYREGKHFIRFEISDLPNGFRLEFFKPAELKSFLSYVSGYYRLTVKWMLDLCAEYYTPSLLELKELKVHGPIGGEFSYAKIREKNNKCGSYIIRQCEKEYDTYYIDINTRPQQTETFKITRDLNNKWNLHMQECIRPFDKLTDLVLSIETLSEQKFRIPPSEYDKPPLLLICLRKNQVTVKKTVDETFEAELQKRKTQIIDPKTDLFWYKHSQKNCDDGLVQLWADWILPGDFHKKVTLKVLKSEKYVPEFFKLANDWSKMNSPEFLKLYGITLQTPHTMVIEHPKYGPLNEFLQTMNTNCSLLCLLEAVHGLVRAVVYMQEYKIIHGYIRCSTIQVVKYDGKTMLTKLSDPGFPKTYKAEDLPWIPFEYHQKMESTKKDPYAEFWAFATTVWEIFSRGKAIDKLGADVLRHNYNCYGGILPEPDESDFPEDMYPIILDGWSSEPEKRFNQQLIFSRLASIKESSLPNYSTVGSSSEATALTSLLSGSIRSNSSLHSGITDHTTLNGDGGCGSSGAGSDPGSLNSISENSFYYDKTPLLHQNHHHGRTRHISQNSGIGSLTKNTAMFYPQSYFDETPSIVQLSDAKVIYKEKIGEGHYGTVFRGELHFIDRREPKQVAIKTLKSSIDLRSLNQDFMREIHIMKSLSHPNIVKILRSIERPQISIIMEYVECGSFIVYLSSKKPNLTNEKLLRFAMEIASGMDYLRSKNVIHRDLAARNILVDSESVKISDFGLAQIADSDGYYFVKSDREIPIKWYAPETIKTNKFSFQSDVWSYGVTLFEMFSRGQQPNLDPNNDLSQTEILNRLEQGDRLSKPTICPDNVYEELMWPCWNDNPKKRPDFRQIMGIIQDILSENGEFI